MGGAKQVWANLAVEAAKAGLQEVGNGRGQAVFRLGVGKARAQGSSWQGCEVERSMRKLWQERVRVGEAQRDVGIPAGTGEGSWAWPISLNGSVGGVKLREGVVLGVVKLVWAGLRAC